MNTNTKPSKFSVRREYLNRGGYTSTGSYFGCCDELLYYVTDESTGMGFYLRARDRAEAKQKVAARHPGARFYR